MRGTKVKVCTVRLQRESSVPEAEGLPSPARFNDFITIGSFYSKVVIISSLAAEGYVSPRRRPLDRDRWEVRLRSYCDQRRCRRHFPVKSQPRLSDFDIRAFAKRATKRERNAVRVFGVFICFVPQDLAMMFRCWCMSWKVHRRRTPWCCLLFYCRTYFNRDGHESLNIFWVCALMRYEKKNKPA